MKNKQFIEDGIGFAELLEVFGSDLTIVNAARVSFNKESHMVPVQDQEGNIVGNQLSERDEKLIDYLASHHHVTPFFHPIVRFRIKMPLFVAREWFRHVVGFARNEVSRRYVTEEPEFFIPKVLRKRDANVRQGSSKDPIQDNDVVTGQMKEHCKQVLVYYKELLEKQEVCPEQARIILPQTMYTEFIETGSVAAYARLVKLRDEASAQKEIQDYAHLVSLLMEEHFPVAWKALIPKDNENE